MGLTGYTETQERLRHAETGAPIKTNGKQQRNGKQQPSLPKINIVSQKEAEEADVVVCMPIGSTRYFTDDVETVCSECGRGIFHRPHAPKKPRKVCIDCALKLTEQESEEP